MALTRPRWIAFGIAGGFAVAMPALLLSLSPAAPSRPASPAGETLRPSAIPPVAAIYERSLFAPADAAPGAPADAPALVGIAGRLNRDAVALVRLADGSSRSIGVGESVEGWRLDSLAIDAAFFVRGRERVRVAMAGEQPPPATPDQ